MSAGSPTAVPCPADDLPLPHFLSRGDERRREMSVPRPDAAGVFNHDGLSVATFRPGRDNATRRCRRNVLSVCGSDVDAAMKLRRAMKRIGAPAKFARDFALGNCDCGRTRGRHVGRVLFYRPANLLPLRMHLLERLEQLLAEP